MKQGSHTTHQRLRSVIAAASLLLTAGTQSALAQTTVTLPLDITGEVRVRSEYEHAAATSGDLFTYLRSRLGVRVTPAAGVRVLLQMQDSRVLGSEGIARAAAADVLELHQGYLEIDRAVRTRAFAVRAGRQEISVGNERLVGVSNWTNLGRSFDGFRVTLASDTNARSTPKLALNAMAATVEERGARFGATATDAHPTDHTVAGLFATRELPRTTSLEGLLLYDGSGAYRRYSKADRGTLYGRARTTLPFRMRADLEAGWQFGHQKYRTTDTSAATPQDIAAWLLAARIGTPTMGARKMTLGLGADLLSGDATPTDGTYGAFSTMYASNHSFYGLGDLIGDPAATTHERGLLDVLATGSMNVSNNVSLRGEAHRFTMAAGTNRALGSELDLIMPVRVGSAANVELGYTAFFADQGAAALSLGANHSTRQWAYVQLRAGF